MRGKPVKLCRGCGFWLLVSDFNKNRCRKDGLQDWCRKCTAIKVSAWGKRNRDKRNITSRKVRARYPWYNKLSSAKSRCDNPKHRTYQSYGGRGIKCLLNIEQVRRLWIRDRADELDFPELDRIDPDGNYCFENCRFIEKSRNRPGRRGNTAHCSKGHKFTEQSTFFYEKNGKVYRTCRVCRNLNYRKLGEAKS